MMYRAGFGQSSPSLLNLADWQEKEKVNPVNCAVDENGALLDNLTLELRVTPPEISIDNTVNSKYTFVKLSSANRPGSLIHVVQHFTELGLHIHSSRVTSCGGWFVDDFLLSEGDGKKILNQAKLRSIQQMLSAFYADDSPCLNGDETDDTSRVESTVFELAGPDGVGLLADVTRLLTHNGCNVRSAAVWTYRGRVAFVLSVTEKGRPIADEYKLGRLRQLVTAIMGGEAVSTIRLKSVRGEVHPDRRLHQLMLHEELEAWAASGGAAVDVEARAPAGGASASDDGDGDDLPTDSELSADTMLLGSPDSARGGGVPPRAPAPPAGASGDSASSLGKASGAALRAAAAALVGAAAPGRPPVRSASLAVGGAGGGSGHAPTPAVAPSAAAAWRSPKYDRPSVDIERCDSSGYWIVSIACRDRPKLLFDTVCTLADMDYDIWHATIDALPGGGAVQEYHVRPRGGEVAWDPEAAACLAAMLESSIQRRFPAGVKLHVRSVDRFGGLADLTRVLSEAGLSITRAKVRTYVNSNSSGHTFYVMSKSGQPPDRTRIQEVCTRLGGNLVEAGQESQSSSLGSHRFTFSFLNRSAGSPMSSSCGSV
ncbi:hypothetical protein ACKKBF_B35580 [Auxenochlorella protothecoides x Auxenochlorella symbiontica]